LFYIGLFCFILFSFFGCSATSFADALKAWRGGDEVDAAEHGQQSHQQDYAEQPLPAKPEVVRQAEAQPSAILSIVCYNCCKKVMGEAALSCIQVCSKTFCSTACSESHWSKNKIRCPAPACPRRFFLLKDGVARDGAAFCCSACADSVGKQ
jgi:hypothetical protein